jgi:small subunit ribosomal protein S4
MRFFKKSVISGEKIFGQKVRKRRRTALTEYGRQLREKQKLKALYNLRERQFKKYIKEVMAEKGNSRAQARQLVNHGHFLVNGRKVNIPSFELRKGDQVQVRAASLKKNFFKKIQETLKKHKRPNWLSFDIQKMEAKVVGLPSIEEVQLPVQVPLIFEFYSR